VIVSYWPLAAGRDFPKQAVQAAAAGKSSHSLSEAIPGQNGPVEHLEFQLFIASELVKSRDTLKIEAFRESLLTRNRASSSVLVTRFPMFITQSQPARQIRL
jgi:hypothetical protein